MGLRKFNLIKYWISINKNCNGNFKEYCSSVMWQFLENDNKNLLEIILIKNKVELIKIER